tara:strand:+ start:2091 stop:3053 length:963 start_codon:yes stop_codon:yes gene_type:complete
MKKSLHNINTSNEFRELILGMRKAFKEGNNAMEFARSFFSSEMNKTTTNDPLATMIAYDLQSGSYVNYAKNNKELEKIWGLQLASLISPFLPENGTILEVGVGEATTLSSLINALGNNNSRFLGFDLSWSRIKIANNWLLENSNKAELFVGDIFNIPLADNSVDIVYSSHSLEPNGGSEALLIKECYRVARKAVVLVEPIYELASYEAQKRMDQHGYIKGLYEVAKNMNCSIEEYKLLEHSRNLLNPSGVLTLKKSDYDKRNLDIDTNSKGITWQCPLTKCFLKKLTEAYYAMDSGIAYPILREIPLLRRENGVVASLFE